MILHVINLNLRFFPFAFTRIKLSFCVIVLNGLFQPGEGRAFGQKVIENEQRDKAD